MSVIRDLQLDIMAGLAGICAILSVVTLIPRMVSQKRKFILGSMAFASMLLLVFERYAYLFRGDTSELGYYMVRVSNGMSFFLLLFIPFLVTQYLKDLYLREGELPRTPLALRLSEFAFLVGTALLVVSQFTGLYYTIDAQNVYCRAPGLVISYVPAVLIILLQAFTVIKYRKRLSRGLFLILISSLLLPTVASIVQLYVYGVSLTCMATAFVVTIYYLYYTNDICKTAEKARIQEVEFYKEARRIEAALFEQTVEALINAVDAKDIYTHGHSSRVAAYSRQIAELAGLTEKERNEVYFAALLHDVGKIGIPDGIINKDGMLTDEEFERVKSHTVMGAQILSSIKQSPSLSVGAHYHHERYDGKGYPEGLAGEEIPEIARIIAVADAYDAMTSKRSYRDPLPLDAVRQELTEGIGKQFDPRFARIMLQILDSGTGDNK